MKTFLPTLFSDQGLMRDPFAALRRQMNELSESLGREWPLSTEVGAGAPAVNVAETEKAIEITAELPGVDAKDVKVQIEGQNVIVSGEKKREREEKEKNWHLVERSYGSFRRAVTLPFEPAHDAVSANFDNGVLRIDIAKPANAKSTAKTVEIKTGGAGETKPNAQSKAA